MKIDLHVIIFNQYVFHDMNFRMTFTNLSAGGLMAHRGNQIFYFDVKQTEDFMLQ